MPVACFRCALLRDWTDLLVANWTHFWDQLVCAHALRKYCCLSPCESSATKVVLPDIWHVKCHFSGFSDSILHPQRQPASPTQTMRKRGKESSWKNGTRKKMASQETGLCVIQKRAWCAANIVWCMPSTGKSHLLSDALCSSWTILRNMSKRKATFGRQKSRLRF